MKSAQFFNHQRTMAAIVFACCFILPLIFTPSISNAESVANEMFKSVLPNDVVIKEIAENQIIINAAVSDIMELTPKDIEKGRQVGFVMLPSFEIDGKTMEPGGYYIKIKATEDKKPLAWLINAKGRTSVSAWINFSYSQSADKDSVVDDYGPGIFLEAEIPDLDFRTFTENLAEPTMSRRRSGNGCTTYYIRYQTPFYVIIIPVTVCL